MHIDSLATEIHDREVPSYQVPGKRHLYYLTVLVTITEDKDEKDRVLTLKEFPVGREGRTALRQILYL